MIKLKKYIGKYVNNEKFEKFTPYLYKRSLIGL